MNKKTLIIILALIAFPINAIATVQFMDTFNKDKAAKASQKNKCTVCHTSATGGGARNDFGNAFSAAGNKITDNLRSQFPKLFEAIQAAAPKISRVKPPSAKVGQEVTLMIMGSGFAADSVVKVDGSDFSGATFVSSKRIDITLTFDSAGVHTVQVVSATGQTSKAFKVKVK